MNESFFGHQPTESVGEVAKTLARDREIRRGILRAKDRLLSTLTVRIRVVEGYERPKRQ